MRRITPAMQVWLGSNITELPNLPVRVCNMLEQAGLRTVEDLLNTPQQELAAIPYFGRTCLTQVLKALESIGFVPQAKEKSRDRSRSVGTGSRAGGASGRVRQRRS